MKIRNVNKEYRRFLKCLRRVAEGWTFRTYVKVVKPCAPRPFPFGPITMYVSVYGYHAESMLWDPYMSFTGTFLLSDSELQLAQGRSRELLMEKFFAADWSGGSQNPPCYPDRGVQFGPVGGEDRSWLFRRVRSLAPSSLEEFELKTSVI